MKNSNSRTILYGLLGLASLMISSIGYVYGHKAFTADNLMGIFQALWQIGIAFIIIAVAAGMGEFLLRNIPINGLTRSGLTVAIGLLILSISMMILGAILGTSVWVMTLPLLFLAIATRKEILKWMQSLGVIRSLITNSYELVIAIGALSILGIDLMVALAPPTEFDSLTYHFAIPNAYLQAGRIIYLPNTMFWGMPQLVEMLYVPVMKLAGVEAASVLGLLVGIMALIGILDFVTSKFNGIAAWTTVAAILAGASLSWSLSTGYVDWTTIFFGWATLVALDRWLESHERWALILSGIFCGGALGTKYTAGIILLGSLLSLAVLQQGTWRQKISSIFFLGLAAVAASSPWWIKNLLATGNPFYPFFIPAGAMDQIRISFYQKAPGTSNWLTAILLPWQATIFGIDGKEGYSASIGPLLVGLSPLVWIRWKSRSEAQRKIILIAGITTITGLCIWAVGSRISGLLIQTRLYFGLFPTWALLAGVGLEALWNQSAAGIRFGKLMGALVLLMFCLNIFGLAENFITRNPLAYVLRMEDERSYLLRTLGSEVLAMDAIQALPENSHVLMLWETRGYYCQPRCDSDEVIDRWYHDSTVHPDSKSIIQAWHEQGYTHLLIFNTGADFEREYDPGARIINWPLLDETLAELPIEKDINDGTYTLYRLP